MDYVFKVTKNDFLTYNGSLFLITLNIDLTVWTVEDWEKIQKITGQLIGCDTISEKW